MAKFLTTNGTSYHIENIIIGAEKKLVLVSPYLQLSKTFFERLKDAANNEVAIKIIYGKDALKPNERNSLAQLRNLELFYFDNLHAKCFFNESEMVITSMNMYEYSMRNNREMGIFITKANDPKLFSDAVNETHSIIKSSELITLTRTERQLYKPNRGEGRSTKIKTPKKPTRGYCLRCETRIPYNTTRPYCWDCYSIWSVFENYQYQENVCHSCGEFASASMEKPLCLNCFKQFSS